MQIFPSEMPGSRPTYLFYDDNCQLFKFIRSCGASVKQFFAPIGLPVDVFHFTSKHKITDTVCQEHCNPTSFPDLRDDNGWTFNSSAAEQTNVWFGKYDVIVREMHQHRYNFFLDEMITLRNDYTLTNLVRKGRDPILVPHDDLYSPQYVA